MNEIKECIKVNNHDVLVFLAGDDRFTNVTQLGQAHRDPGKTFDRYLVGGQGQRFVETLSRAVGVPADRLYYYRPGEGYYANHKVALDFAGWLSPYMQIIYYDAVESWARARLGQAEVSKFRDDPVIQMTSLIRDLRISQLEIEQRVESQERRIDQMHNRVEDTVRRADMAVDTVEGKHRWYALGPWADKVAGINLGSQQASWEATNVLIPMCEARGIKPQRVSSSRYVHINCYPEEMLEAWADDFRRRYPGMEKFT